MTDHAHVRAWIDGYVSAWNSNDPREIGDLFTDDAEYRTAPFRPPWRGREEIVDGWLDRKDEPGEAAFEWRSLAIDGDLAIIEATTRYPDEMYSNLWVIGLDAEGRCTSFTEWWMEQPAVSPE